MENRAERTAVWHRCRGRCEARLPGVCTTVGEAYHHRRPWNEGGADARTNLLMVCAACHARIHARPDEAALAGWLIPEGAPDLPEPAPASPDDELDEPFALDWEAVAAADAVRAQDVRCREARERRDRLARTLFESGRPLREIAKLVGLSHPGVKKIVERVEEQG